MAKAPCKACENIGCGRYHSECPTFKEYQEKLKEERRKKKQDEPIQGYYFRKAKRERVR